jgi:hypothetical protein
MPTSVPSFHGRPSSGFDHESAFSLVFYISFQQVMASIKINDWTRQRPLPILALPDNNEGDGDNV